MQYKENLEYEDNYDELIDNNKIKKIKLSEKLKILEDSNPYINLHHNLIVTKIMFLTYSEPKFKLLQNLQMYKVENLLPESKISYLESLSYNGIYGENKTYHVHINVYEEFVTDVRFEISINNNNNNNDNYDFNPTNFKYSDIFESFNLMINNAIIETIDSKLIEFILSKTLQKKNMFDETIPSCNNIYK